MSEINKLDYDKEIADMEQLIGVLKDMWQVKGRLRNAYLKQAQDYTRNGFTTNEDVLTLSDESLVKSYNMAIDVFQLNAEIELKENVLIELKKRAEEDVKQTELTAKQADMNLEDRIKQAKELAANSKVSKDVREKLTSRFIDPYRKRFKFGFKDDVEKAAFFKALIQIIEAAENFTKSVKK